MTSGATWDLRSEALQTFSVEVENTQKTAQLIGAQLHENFQKAQLLQSELTCIITTSIEKILEAPPPPLVPITPLPSRVMATSTSKA